MTKFVDDARSNASMKRASSAQCQASQLTLLSKDCLQCEARRSHPRNRKMKAKNLFRASRGVINATPLYELPSAACNFCARGTSVSWLRHWSSATKVMQHNFF